MLTEQLSDFLYEVRYDSLPSKAVDNAKLYLQEHPDVADRIEQEVRENMWKLQGSRAKPPIAPASKAVNVSADDFNDET